MTEKEYRLYELADYTQELVEEMERYINGILYDPDKAAAEDIRAMEKIRELVGEAAWIAKQTSDRMFGYNK